VDNKHEDKNLLINKLKVGLESMKDILDNAYQGIVLVDKEGRIIKWNYENLLGMKEEDVLGKPVEEVIENTRLHIVVKTGKKERERRKRRMRMGREAERGLLTAKTM
jgi:PAS domain S-box-containing protein